MNPDALDRSRARPAQGHRRRALALQILRGILVNVPPPPLWLWSAGAGDLEGHPRQGAAPPLWLWNAGAPDPDRDSCQGAAAPPVVMERWCSRSWGRSLSRCRPPLWLWSAGAPDSGGDPVQRAAAPLWLWTAGAGEAQGQRCRAHPWHWAGSGAPGAPQQRPRGSVVERTPGTGQAQAHQGRPRSAPGAPQGAEQAYLLTAWGRIGPPPLTIPLGGP